MRKFFDIVVRQIVGKRLTWDQLTGKMAGGGAIIMRFHANGRLFVLWKALGFPQPGRIILSG
jgi:hypothetical protein